MPFPVPGSEQFAYRPNPGSVVRASLPNGFAVHAYDESMQSLVDPLSFEVIRHRLWAITEEMADALKRMSGSIVVTDCNDFNACIMNEIGEEVQIGLYCMQLAASIDMAVKWTLENRAENPGIRDGDMFISTDPWVGGGTHQNDMSVFAPVFWDGELFAWVNTVAHQVDLGGVAPGSWTPKARDVFWESVPLPPTKIYEDGQVRRDAEDAYLRRSRLPRLVALDLRAEIGANLIGVTRLKALIAKYGPDRVKAVMHRMMGDAEGRLRAKLRELPDGRWRSVAYQEQAREGDRGLYKIVCEMTKRADALTFDFRGTDPQVDGLINCSYSGMRAGVLVAILTLLCGDIPWSPEGFFRCFDIVSDEGTLNNCTFPAGLSKGSVAAAWSTQSAASECVASMMETTAESREHIIGIGAGTFDLALMAGIDQRGDPFVAMLGDPMASGMGARFGRDGVDTGGMHNIAQSRTTDVELNEFSYPVLYLWRREEVDSGGPGQFRGGLSGSSCFILYGTTHQEMSLTVSHTGKAVPQNPGLSGGYPGNTAYDVMFRGTTARDGLTLGVIPSRLDDIDGTPEILAAELDTAMGWDDVYYTNWQAGGGLGDPLVRAPDAVKVDLEEEKISSGAAYTVYGVVINDDGQVDEHATGVRRSVLRMDRLGGGTPSDTGTTTDTIADFDINLRSTLSGETVCGRCGTVVGSVGGEFLDLAAWRSGPPQMGGPQIRGDADSYIDVPIEFRQACCPGCAIALLTEIVPEGVGHRIKAPERTFVAPVLTPDAS